MQNTRRLISDLNSPKEAVRRKATYALGSLALGVPVDIVPLIEATRNDDGQLRFWGLVALGRIYQSFDEIVPVIAKCLEDANTSNRQAASSALGNYAEFSGAYIDSIAHLLNDENTFVRQDALRALSRFPSLPDRTIQKIVASLDDTEADVRSTAATAIKMLGPMASSVEDVLKKRIELVLEPDMQLEVALSFMRFCKEVRTSVLIDMLLSGSQNERDRAIWCLSYLPDAPMDILEKLENCLDAADFETQLAASKAIRRQAAHAVQMRQSIVSRLGSDRWAATGRDSIIREHLIVAAELMDRASTTAL